jgi:hypothetical protein
MQNNKQLVIYRNFDSPESSNLEYYLYELIRDNNFVGKSSMPNINNFKGIINDFRIMSNSLD